MSQTPAILRQSPAGGEYMAVDIMDKLEILADGAKYDVSCASSNSLRRNRNGVGNAASCRKRGTELFSTRKYKGLQISFLDIYIQNTYNRY
jgi:predicted DNA-binding helix-hairpin-helix protein